MYQSVMPTAVGVRLLLRHEAGVKRAGMCCSYPSASPPHGGLFVVLAVVTEETMTENKLRINLRT